MPATGSPSEASLYFHIPFCTKKCPYCHFFVLPDKDPFKEELLRSLRIEWEREAPKFREKKIISLYFGGGTPSLLGAEKIGEILSWLPDTPDQEVTLEVNPENVTPPLMEGFRAAGINRVSIGVQTLDNPLLKRLGRTHTAQKALDAIFITHQAGIHNISIDLMYDLPGQTLTSWEATLDQIEHLPITHLSLYNLTIEPHTPFYKKEKELTPLLPNPETSLAMLNAATTRLPSFGLNRYEISAFAKVGYASRHNTGYWTGRPFLGLGPSAFSYWNYKRYRNIANLKAYSAALKEHRSPVDFSEELPPDSRRNELLAVHLRLLKGVHLPTFEMLHGPLPLTTREALIQAREQGWLDYTPTHAQLTPEGLLFYDSLASLIV